MVRISNRKVQEQTLRAISNQLIRYIAKVRTHTSAEQLLEELLTETERIMLAKRFAIIVLLARGYSYAQIQETLKVSPSTIARYWKEWQQGEFKHLVAACDTRRNRNAGTLLELVEQLLQAGLPPQGKDRWKFLDKHFD